MSTQRTAARGGGPQGSGLQCPGPQSAAAVFLDRDGVLNRNVFYADTGQYESPRTAAELILAQGVGQALSSLRAAGYGLILVSNQPNAAKGKCTREALDEIHARLLDLLAAVGVELDAAYYCYHHPDYTGPCRCRKPSPHFLFEAAARFRLDLAACWMIGDRASDVACGRAVGTRTIWVDTGEAGGVLTREERQAADLVACGLKEAAGQLLAASRCASR